MKFNKINIFVGANNSGKSNIVRALKLFFDVHAEIVENDLYTAIRTQTVNLNAVISVNTKKERRFLISNNLEKLLKQNKMKIKREQHLGEKAKYYDIGKPKTKRLIKNQELYNLKRFFQKYFTFMDVISSENLDFNHLEKVLSHIPRIKISEYVKDQFEKKIESAFNSINNRINALFVTSASKFAQHLGVPEKDIAFEIVPDHTQMLSNIRLQIKQGDLNASLMNKGQGVKNISALILAGVFDAHRNHIVVLEEPEIHLHPSLTRSLMDSINSAHHHKQFFITTHSSTIIDSVAPNNIQRVVMKNGKTEVIAPSPNDKMEYNFYKYIHSRHSECLLSKRVVITEGDTEIRAIPDLSRKVKLRRGNLERTASLDIEGIQLVQVNGGNFHNPIKFLQSYKIDWLILGDDDKWPREYLATIKALNLHKKHPRKFIFLKKKAEQKILATEEIRKILYEYFQIICLPRKFEDLLVTNNNVQKVSQLLQTYLSDRYKNCVRHNNGKSQLEICRMVMKNDKPQWAIILARKLDKNSIPDEITQLLNLIVNRPKTGFI